MKVFLMGAGASKSYTQSPTSVKMPIAIDFFKTYNELKISENPWIRVGDIVNYVSEKYQIDPTDFNTFKMDIEKIHSEVEEDLKYAIEKGEDLNIFMFHRAYMQLVFLFSSVINEIQNGSVSIPHVNLTKIMSNEDNIITYNWDTLMDRALYTTTDWTPDSGYLVKPRMINKDGWSEPDASQIKSPKIIKLHGSTNWLTSYMIVEDGKFTLTQELDPNTFYVYQESKKPYPTYDGRYMSGYNPFSYGYYPVNLPELGKHVPEDRAMLRIKMRGPFHASKGTSDDSGLVSMPLIIPPVKYKSYSMFGSLFQELWKSAEEVLSKAEHIIIIGYSFPITDIQSNSLFINAFMKRVSYPRITILDPNPDRIVEKFNLEFGIPKSKIKVIKDFFTEDFDVNKLVE